MPKTSQCHLACFLTILALTVCGCDSDDSHNEPPTTAQPEPATEEPGVTQFLYTQANDARGNHAVGFRVDAHGNLIELGSFATGSVGDADEGDFDSQSSVRVYDDYLLVANPGDANSELGVVDGNSAISVFEIAEDGLLTRIDQNPEIDGIQNSDSRGTPSG